MDSAGIGAVSLPGWIFLWWAAWARRDRGLVNPSVALWLDRERRPGEIGDSTQAPGGAGSAKRVHNSGSWRVQGAGGTVPAAQQSERAGCSEGRG